MADSKEQWADSSEKSTERYGYIKDSTALGRGSDEIYTNKLDTTQCGLQHSIKALIDKTQIWFIFRLSWGPIVVL